MSLIATDSTLEAPDMGGVVQSAVDATAQAIPVQAPRTWSSWPWWAKAFHVFVIFNLLAQMAYASWQVFVVMQPPGVVGPMFGAAQALPFEDMIVRRMYALEGWIAFGILAVYVALTELVPRIRAAT